MFISLVSCGQSDLAQNWLPKEVLSSFVPPIYKVMNKFAGFNQWKLQNRPVTASIVLLFKPKGSVQLFVYMWSWNNYPISPRSLKRAKAVLLIWKNDFVNTVFYVGTLLPSSYSQNLHFAKKMIQNYHTCPQQWLKENTTIYDGVATTNHQVLFLPRQPSK